MRKKENFLPIFILLFIVSFILFKTNFSLGFFGKIIIPIQRTAIDFFSLPKNIFINNFAKDLREENLALVKKLVDQNQLQRENLALKDQFETASPKSQNLLPAKIVGSPGFLPWVSAPETLVLDKGTKDNVKVGQAVVFKDNLIGKTERVSTNLSIVTLITNKNSAFAAKTSKTEALGIMRGQGGGEMVLENVLLSDGLQVSDAVLTKGDLNAQMLGYPPNLIVGKIVSLEKKPSALFQSAKIKSLIDFPRLSTVFIITEY